MLCNCAGDLYFSAFNFWKVMLLLTCIHVQVQCRQMFYPGKCVCVWGGGGGGGGGACVHVHTHTNSEVLQW